MALVLLRHPKEASPIEDGMLLYVFFLRNKLFHQWFEVRQLDEDCFHAEVLDQKHLLILFADLLKLVLLDEPRHNGG